uniref:Uncharacterized protein n=1 Tax=viral metagenome TaxID=1070528 RepID=A0A6C0DM18_9ZZZZ
MSISNNLQATKIDVGSVAGFGQSLSILNPELSPCPARYSFDQYGRPAAPDSLDTTTCPGLYDPSVRIQVENSLRSYLSPRYFNLPKGIDQGTDTMFGRSTSKGRNYLNTETELPDASLYLKSDSTLTEAGMLNRPAFAPASYLLYERRV